jgi:glucose dehydrogenase
MKSFLIASMCVSGSLLPMILGCGSGDPVLHPSSSDWKTYNYSSRGTRHNAVEKKISVDNAKNLKIKWRFPTINSKITVGAIHATPAVVNGYTYFGTATYPMFYKIAPNGKLKWKYEPGNEMRRRRRNHQRLKGDTPKDGIFSSALVTEDSVYFGDISGVAYCLDRQTGKEKWTVDSQAEDFPGAHPFNVIMASPIKVDDKIIFAGGAFEHMAPLQPGYRCCTGRGFVMALDPQNGNVIWKYDVGPEPVEFDPPLTLQTAFGERTFHYGPSTSSVWSTPSYDPETQTIFFGTDVHNSPRKLSKDDPRNYTPHSAAVIALDANTGKEKWVAQTNKNDIWNYTMPAYDAKTGYKDQAVGDTPKIFSIDVRGEVIRVVGAGAKNGGFYLMRVDNGDIVASTPVYTGPPADSPKTDPRTLALPSPIGGLQTGCATDGKAIFTNGIDTIFKGTPTERKFDPPTGGRVTSISLDTTSENWRHERPKVDWVGGTKEQPLFTNCGDPVASGIAVANGCLFFTTLTSNKLVILNAANGKVLKEFYLGPVLSGPSVSRGRVFVGTGNTKFIDRDIEAYFPKSTTGVLYSFGLPKPDELDQMGEGNE